MFFSFLAGVYVGILNLIASIPDPSILTSYMLWSIKSQVFFSDVYIQILLSYKFMMTGFDVSYCDLSEAYNLTFSAFYLLDR